MKKSLWSKIFSIGLILTIVLTMFPLTSLPAAMEAIKQAEFLSTIPDLNEVMMENSSELAESIDFTQGEISGYGSNGRFLAPIEPPVSGSIPISTRRQLEAIGNNSNSRYHLVNDIDLGGAEWVPISSFTGIFDGQGYVIKNLTITSTTIGYYGLFGSISNTLIKNIGLEGTNINASRGTYNSHAGGICGFSSASSIFNCYNIGSISSVDSSTRFSTYSYAGGISGYSNTSSISYCYNSGSISSRSSSLDKGVSYSYAGGISGCSGSLSYCYNTGSVSSRANAPEYISESYAGGISGYGAGISYCFNSGGISSSGAYNVFAGGISGYSGFISNCYNTGGISSSSSSGVNYAYVGGICSNYGSISYCYNTGSISISFSRQASYAGGISGYGAGISNCVVLSGKIHVEQPGGSGYSYSYLIGYGATKINSLASEGITGNAIDDADERITLEQAREQATYDGLEWDFDRIWHMVSGYAYPQLQGLPPAGPIYYSDDANLADLNVSPGMLSPVFDADQTSYTVSVPYNISNLTISATTSFPGAGLSGVGVKAINKGANEFPIMVTAENGATKTYTITVNRPEFSDDAKLKSLSLDPSVIRETFDPDNLKYTANVPYDTSSVNITAETRDLDAKIISGTGLKTLYEGISTFLFQVTVMAADNTAIETYEIMITRLSNDAKLKSLSVSTDDDIVQIAPSFNPDEINYTASVPYEVSNVTISAAVSHPKAELDGVGLKSLEVGANNFDIEVSAEDSSIKKTYTVTINRAAPSSDADLCSLSVSQGILSPAFQSDITSYTVSVPYEIDEIIVESEANHPVAKIDGNGSQYLEVGDNYIIITVTAQDSTTKTYTIVLTRKTQTHLVNLISSTGTLTPSFDPDILSYTISIEGDVSSISITALAGGPDIRVGFSEGSAYQIGDQWISYPINLDTGEKEIAVYVYKEMDHIASYSITIIRDPSSTPAYKWEVTGDIGTIGRVLFDIPAGSNFLDMHTFVYDEDDFLNNFALVCDEDIDAEIFFSPKRTENAITAGQNTYIFAVRLPNGETREDISFSFKPIGGAIEKNKVIIYGDINEDGNVTTTDATLVTRWAGGNTAAVLRNILAADVNGDASITTTDATLITRRAGGNPAVFSIETRF